MFYLAGHPSLPHRQECQGITFSLQQPAEGALIETLIEQFRKTGAPRRIATLRGTTDNYFIKTTQLTSFTRRLRISLGLPFPGKGLDWELAELVNTLKLGELGIPSPRLLGYGYRSKAGLVDTLCLISEHLEGYLNGAEWLEARPERAGELLESICDAILEMHRKQVYLLDMWLGNIMLTAEAPQELKLIDFESCCFGESRYTDEVLGLIFGQLYYGTLKSTFKDFLSEADFDRNTEKYLAQLPEIDRERFYPAYEAAKFKIVNRKERRKIFERGLKDSKLLKS